jgi:hypothetical protein
MPYLGRAQVRAALGAAAIGIIRLDTKARCGEAVRMLGARRYAVALWAVAIVAAALPWSASDAAAATVPFQRGVTVGEWGPTAYAPAATKRTLRTLAGAFDVDTVTLFVAWEQKDARATRIGPAGRAAPRRRIASAIEAARRAGLRVTLRPYVDRLDGGWRGQIAPSSLDRWFKSYEQFILEFARIAQAHRVNTFVVGSEMVSLSGRAARWRRLVKRVRSRFHGTVTYQANWDEANTITWWDALDVISISAYYPLSRIPSPSVAEVVAGWRQYRGDGPRPVDWVDQVRQLHNRYRKRVAFSEIGYRPVSRATAEPWNIGSLGSRSPRTQANAYEAAFRVWYRVPWFRGFNWWYVSPQPSLVQGLPGADHRPGTRALRVLQRWYARAR